MTDSGDQDLDAARLRLEIEKFRFEERKFEAEAESRAEELARLRSERQKAELEVDELRAPFYEKPQVITAFFQGIALVIAVVSALISLGTWNALRDATLAKQDAAIAKTEKETAERGAARARDERIEAETKKEKAQDAAGKADEEKTRAQADLATAQRLRDAANADVERAEKSADLAPVEVILSSLKDTKYYPIRFNEDVQTYSDGTPHNPEIKLLLDSIKSSDRKVNSERIKFLMDYALRPSEPLGVRLAVLRVLDETAMMSNVPELRPYQLRDEFIETAISVQSGEVDRSALLSLLNYPFDKSEASRILCTEYHGPFQSGESDEGGFRESLESFIADYFTYRKLGDTVRIDLNDETCIDAVWSWLSPEADPWKYRHPKESRLFQDDDKAFVLNTYGRFPTFTIVARYFREGNPRVGNRSDEVLLDVPVGPQGEKKTVAWHVASYDWAAASLDHDAPPERSDLAKDVIPNFMKWIENNQDVIELLKEPELKRLRTCDPKLLERLYKNNFIGRPSILELCPAGTLPAKP